MDILFNAFKAPGFYNPALGILLAAFVCWFAKLGFGAVQKKDYEPDKRETNRLLSEISEKMATREDVRYLGKRIDNTLGQPYMSRPATRSQGETLTPSLDS